MVNKHDYSNAAILVPCETYLKHTRTYIRQIFQFYPLLLCDPKHIWTGDQNFSFAAGEKLDSFWTLDWETVTKGFQWEQIKNTKM